MALVRSKLWSGAAGEDPATPRLFYDVLIVLSGFEAEQRELEAILSTGFSMATPRITARLRQDGHDVVGEVQRALFPTYKERRKEKA